MSIKMNSGSISIGPISKKNNIDKNNIIDMSYYKNIYLKRSGEDVQICLIDTGYPDNPYIKRAFDNCVSCTDTPVKFNKDKIGHATYNASIIKRLSSDYLGIAYGSGLFYANVYDKNVGISYSSIITAILWSISVRMDIICLPLSADYDFLMLKSVIEKAKKNNIAIFAPVDGKNKFPAIYDGVYSIGKTKTARKKIRNVKGFEFNIKGEKQILSGLSLYCALYSGLCANIIEDYNKKKEKYKIEDLYSQLDLIIDK